MPFGLMCAPTTFQRGMMKIFVDYLDKFMKVFLDDFTVYGTKEDDIEHLEKCLIRCRENGVSLNPEKCYFCVNFGRLLGNVVCKEGLLVDPKKVPVIKELPPPTTIRGVGAQYSTEIRKYGNLRRSPLEVALWKVVYHVDKTTGSFGEKL